MFIKKRVCQLTLLLIAAIALVSCAVSFPVPTLSHGRDFNRLTEPQVQYGVTTKQEILELMGKPNITTGESTSRPSITYMFYDRKAKALSPDHVASRLQSFYFDENGKLTGMEYLSSFPNDSTYFIVGDAQKIKLGDTQSRVIEIMGQPSGEHPSPAPQSGYSYVMAYRYPVTRYVDMTYPNVTYNVFVAFDKHSRVAKVEVIEPGDY
ncbi:outer membrane protein assembly factor BamE [Aestuariibacter sp. GS-14]|uniref:outer membrane protein assembly factor BamE domain-containing protein n=1 Tax=Alteromonadaceae TaxID=72275 RepID=UPI001128934D|nr:outer membrane protein assembly factor BamE [Aestuariibacter sp. GS-14]TPV60781.1 outer membrane protein assembly factor BamE [Aestuariibacter sp. GS-14]